MKKKYVSILLSLSMIASLSVSTNITKKAEVVKAEEVTIQTPELDEELIYNPKNYEGDFAPDRVVVSVEKENEDLGAEALFDGIDIKDIRQLATSKGPEDKDMVGGESVENPLYLITLEDAGKENVVDAIETLRYNEGIRYACPDYVVKPLSIPSNYVTQPNDPKFSEQWALQKIGAPLAWNVTTGSDDVVVGVVDTGIAQSHPDFQDNLWTNIDEIPGDGIDNDGNGYIDDVHGWNFADDNNQIEDIDGHGVYVAGVIGATGNNGFGTTGVNMHVKLATLKWPADDGHTSDILECVHYARVMGIEILNHSYGYEGFFPPQYEELALGGLHVCAAGNNATNVDEHPHICYPAGYDLDNIISVTATDSQDNLVDWFANYGENAVDLSAPGDDILVPTKDQTYSRLPGTSLASPHVAGAAALLKSYNNRLTAIQIKEAILNSVDDVPSLHGKVLTGGRLNIAKAFGVVTKFQGTDYKDVFDYDFYKSAYQDVNNTYNSCPIEALKHFVEVGMSEGRPANSEFNPRAYANRYPDLKAQHGDNWKAYYMHYINTGKEEGRVGKTDFRPGDVNGDGVWDDMDLRSMQGDIHFYALAQREGHRYYKAEADMDFDMDIDDDDYEDLARRIRNLARPVTLLGDVNKNGVLDNSDQMAMSGALRAYTMGVSEHNPNPMYTPEADIDRDGDIDETDSELLQAMLSALN